jgi:putative transposase
MHEWDTLSHVRWDCKCHVVFIPKYRHKVLYGKVRRKIGNILHELARQRGVEIPEGHLMADHVHMCVRVAPKHSFSSLIGFLKGKSAVRIHRERLKNRRVTGKHFRARGYCVSTVGLDEATTRRYIREQEASDRQQETLFSEGIE